MEVLKAEHLTKVYGSGENEVLSLIHISFVMIAQAPAHIAYNTRLSGVGISDPYALDLTLINIQ